MTPASIALVSFLMLALQVAWMQALGHAQGHHLAVVVISIALLGFGAGGSVLTLWKSRARGGLERLYAPALLMCALSTALLPALARPLLAGLEVDLLHADPGQWWRLAGLGGAMFLPFFFGAAALSAAFAARAERIGTLYAANLLGSAAGAGATLLLMRAVLPEQAMTWLALLALVAALPARPGRIPLAVATLATLAAILLAPDLPRSPYKELSQALRLPEVHREGPLPHPLGRVDIVTSPALRYAPDLSLRYAGTVPAPPHLFIDGEGAGHLLAADDPSAGILRETPRALPFAATPPPRRVLCLSPGGTPTPLLAVHAGADVTVVEPHPRIARLMQPHIARLPVDLVRADPRLYLAQDIHSPFDLIVFPERGLFGGPVGLQTLGEDKLFTLEALLAAGSRLASGGHLAFPVWLDAPLRHAPRILDLVAESLRATGRDPARHIVAVRGWGSMSVLAGREPFSPETLDAIQAFSREKGFDLLWPPDRTGERTHVSADDTLDDLMAALLGPDPESVRTAYPFDIRAPTDDRPFFNQFLRSAVRSGDLDFLSVSERGLVYLWALLVLLAVGVLVLVLGPLAPLRTAIAPAGFTLPVFLGLGAGFMFFEIVLIQRFTLLWGSPVVSAALVMTALLTGMGLGSAASRRRPATPRRLAALAAGIAVMQMLLPPIVSETIARLLPAPALLRHAGGLTLLVIVAIPLGMPFPMGVRILSARNPGHIPWACGIDGAIAVLTAPAAALLAYRAGYASLAGASAAAYLLAAAAALPQKGSAREL